MKRHIIILAVLATINSVLMAQESIRLSGEGQGSDNRISVKNLQVARSHDKTFVTMDFVLDSLSVPSNRYRAFTPVIRSNDGSRQQRLKTLIVSGRRQNIVFERDGYSCCACGWNIDEYDAEKKSNKRTLQCHHKDYSVLYDEMNHLDKLVTMCSVCHRAIHAAPSNIHRFKKSLDVKLNDDKQ